MTGGVKLVTRDKRARKETSIAARSFMIPEDLIPEMGANSFVIMKACR